ncbi:glyoxylase-like metal-dependent hydrolase (beta-lactamase superfamily II)/rhodanese-related sulfurtransferase [Lewinella aquimaris]|uniref:Glyoxylase-like metal-dependent hydrolase (Beta-lactamase superfamily II)/rhodanese-related sulfurtransferase n=1 Tax=Neolewinella aquimaris TaxID=1835722 RepID=A0A840EDT8_9BACT|nr:rhodanese-like domain-containing protein [Neolewinella aquimaris]MBB4080128.1 glyoxylase-like metal-dependent hydrolase (beta-lactamase superfamily II)/rhodanese-related sulfurtransferase [Neolewinella aquimaris]
MNIKQFFDDGLAHASYVITVGKQAVVIDPARDPQPYYDHLKETGAELIGIIETHPHADFVSAHLEMHETTGAPILVSGKVGAGYTHRAFDGGKTFALGDHSLRALDTPGHSPDSISILLSDAGGKQLAVFTGDTLFVGDVGRPDLRESGGNADSKKEQLARAMYSSLREQLMPLDDEVEVYPAHGAGSLCGKGMSDEKSSTIGKERRENPALQSMTEDAFVDWLLADQPFIPKYFPYDVDLNKRGAPSMQESVRAVCREEFGFTPESKEDAVIIDTREEATFKLGHLKGAINIQEGNKFETWLGSLVAPETPFYLVARDEETLDTVIRKAAKIGYEPFIAAAFPQRESSSEASMKPIDMDHFRESPEDFTIVDIRNASEVEEGKYFPSALNIPLPELSDRTGEIPTDKPIVVHCAGGYRSAAGSSIVAAELSGQTDIFDLSEAVNDFQ